MGWFNKLKQGLKKTSSDLSKNLGRIFKSGKIDASTLEELEETLIQADLGVETSLALVEKLRLHKFDSDISENNIKKWLATEMATSLTPYAKPLDLPKTEKPTVLLMVGVNGSGKTTTIGKLASKFKADGKSVMLAAADTYRAGAVEQLSIWAKRTNTPIITPTKEGSDPAALTFTAHKQAIEQNIDILIIDTAGRLQNRADLMEQLSKMIRVIKKQDTLAPHASLLVIDATVGQNAHSQVKAFSEVAGVTGLVITKLDSTAKGGVVISLADKFKLPIYYVGVGEQIDDLQPFNAIDFTNAMLNITN